ncbi:hypothetical protein FVA95_30135, partial [Pseudonocardia sp. EV170527-09]
FQSTRLLGTAPLGMIFTVTTTKAAPGPRSSTPTSTRSAVTTGSRPRCPSPGGAVCTGSGCAAHAAVPDLQLVLVEGGVSWLPSQ